MEIQQNKAFIVRRRSTVNLQLNSLIRNHDFSIKKAILLLNKYQDRSSWFQQLDVIYQQTTQINYLVNLLMIVQHLLTSESRLNNQNDEKIHWIIRKIYEIRAEIDKYTEINEPTLESLNKLLKTMSNLIVFFARLSSKNPCKLDESSLLQHQALFMISLSGQKMYTGLLNNLFDINLLLKIVEYRSNSQKFVQFINTTILKHFNNIQFSNSDYNEPVKEILLKTLINCLKTIKNFDKFLQNSLQRLLSIFDVPQKLHLVYELKQTNLSIISLIYCQSQHQFQLYSQILSYCSMSSQCNLLQLGQIWIDNLFNLIKNNVQIDLSPIIADLDSSFLVIIYTKISQLFSIKINQLQDKNHIVYLWAKFLLTEKMQEVVLNNKSIVINMQLLLHQFIREILGLIPPSIDFQLNLIILSVYAKYYGLILKQKQCIQINHQTIKYMINKFPQILTQPMIVKEGIGQKLFQMINLENYNPQYLNQLARQYLNKANTQISLDHLQKKVSKILLKYLVDQNIVSLTTILNQTDIIAYTIQNDIELHFDIYQNILENKMYDSIQFYLSLVSKGHSKNRYRRIVDRCCLNLLINQLQDSSNKKIIKINENMVNLLIQNLDFIVHIAAKHNIQALLLFNALFSFISRSLYYNIPIAANYLLMIVLVLKYKVLGQQLLQKEVNLVREIVKFCKMYQGTHRSYYLLGFSALTMLLYGLPCLSHFYVISLNIQQTLNDSTIFLQPIIQIFTGQIQIIDILCHRQTKKLKNEENFQKALKKCILIGLIRHLSHVIKIGSNISTQVIKQFNNLIDQLMMNEASQVDKNRQKLPFDRNNRDMWNQFDDQQKLGISRSQKKQNPLMKNIEQILTKFEQYDEFAQYKQLQKQIEVIYAEHNKQHERLLHSQRVHGKIRMIVHLNK